MSSCRRATVSMGSEGKKPYPAEEQEETDNLSMPITAH